MQSSNVLRFNSDVALSKLTLVMMLVFISGCGLSQSLPPKVFYVDICERLPQISDGQGRMFIFGKPGVAYRPIRIRVDDARMPDIFSGEFYYIDLPAGNHHVASSLFDGLFFEFGKDHLDVELEEGKTLFIQPIVRNSIPVSSRILQVQSKSPEELLKGLEYIGELPPCSATPIAKEK